MKIEILSREKKLDSDNDNVDVEVTLSDGRIFTPTFYTLENVKSLMLKWQETGEYDSGSHFIASDCIIVESLDEQTITRVIKHLVHSNEIDDFSNSNP